MLPVRLWALGIEPRTFLPGVKRQVEVILTVSSDLGFVLNHKCLVVTLKVVRREWTVVIFVERYYDYNI